MNIAGIDPGLTGGIAIVNDQGAAFVADLPVHQLAAGKKVRTELDVASLREILAANPIDHVVIERVAARPGQGVSSMFRFGYGAGAVYGLVVGLGLPCTFITPQVWQRMVQVGPSPDAARRRAAELYPTAAGYLTRKRDAGRADAMLLARAGRQLLGKQDERNNAVHVAEPAGAAARAGVRDTPADPAEAGNRAAAAART